MRTLLESVQGLRPAECPFYSFRDDLVQSVLSIYAARESNLLEPITGGWDSMSRRTVEGLRAFDRYYRRARTHFRRLEQDRADRERKKIQASSRGRR